MHIVAQSGSSGGTGGDSTIFPGSFSGGTEGGPGSLPAGATGFEWQAGRFTFKKPMMGGRKGGGVRGRVAEMTRGSRLRLMRKFASLDWSSLAVSGTPIWFVTLTTPPEYWNTPSVVYGALRRFRDALEYDFSSRGYMGAVVRRERGAKNGMLHYHLVVFGIQSTEFGLRNWIRATWTRSLGYEAGWVRVDVQRPENAERLAKYLGKYCSKAAYEGALSGDTGAADAALDGATSASTLSKAHNVGSTYTGGRWWYVWGAETLPWGEVDIVTGDDSWALAKRVRRIFRRWLVAQASKRIEKQYGASMAGRFSVGFWSRNLSFVKSLKGRSGFTILASPSLLLDFVTAAAIA